MKIHLDFIPDTIIYVKRLGDAFAVRKLWGNKDLFENGKEFFTSLIQDDCNAAILCIQKDTLKCQIFEIEESH